MNLKHIANEIGRGARPASDAGRLLTTLVDRKLVLMWAQNEALRIMADSNTLEEIETELAQLLVLQGGRQSWIPALAS